MLLLLIDKEMNAKISREKLALPSYVLWRWNFEWLFTFFRGCKNLCIHQAFKFDLFLVLLPICRMINNWKYNKEKNAFPIVCGKNWRLSFLHCSMNNLGGCWGYYHKLFICFLIFPWWRNALVHPQQFSAITMFLMRKHKCK